MHSENRAFNYAVLASLVLHAVLLFGFSARERARPADSPAPLVARLVEAPAAAPAPAIAAPRAEPVKPQAVARPKPQPAVPRPVARPQPAPPVEATAQPPAEAPHVSEAQPVAPAPAPVVPETVARVEAAPAVSASPSSDEAGSAQAGAAGSAQAGAAGSAQASAAGSAQASAEARSVAEYRLQLIGAAKKYKRYPRVARQNDSEGVVALRMAFSASGRVASLSVTKTSGYDVLDQQAMEMFKSAAAAVPVPPLLRGKEFAFDLAVIYELFTE